ncbi:MAG: TRAP transporter large permease subunit [Alphaproteobacteria bacterium]
MTLPETLAIALFVVTCAALMAGFPVAFTLAGTGLAFAGLGMGLGIFDFSYLTAFPSRIFGTMTNEVLVAVPLFVFMGVMLERSKVAEDLLDTMGGLFLGLRGGIGISVVVVGALLAASTGIVGATVVTMGLLSLPVMLRRGYDPKLATGTICAAGTLGQIIPPSIVLILLGDQLSIAFQTAQLEQGIFSPETMSVADLFAGALLPGLLIVLLYVGFVALVARFNPAAAPAIPEEERASDMRDLMRRLVGALLPPLLLILAVLGSILTGVATATEAASFGALGATLLAGLRMAPGQGRTVGPVPIYAATLALLGLFGLGSVADLSLGARTAGLGDWAGRGLAIILLGTVLGGLLLSLWRTHHSRCLQGVLEGTVEICAMVFAILIGAALFSLVFRGFGGDDIVRDVLTAMPGDETGALLLVMAVMFALGFFLDFIEITFVVVPIVAPILLMMDVDPVWLGVMMAINLQTSFLTPPFGFALFYLRGVAPPEVRTGDIYRGALPFVGIQIIALALTAAFPVLATWLPSVATR